MDMSKPERCLLGSSDRSCMGLDFLQHLEARPGKITQMSCVRPSLGGRLFGMPSAILYIYANCIYRTPDVAALGAV